MFCEHSRLPPPPLSGETTCSHLFSIKRTTIIIRSVTRPSPPPTPLLGLYRSIYHYRLILLFPSSLPPSTGKRLLSSPFLTREDHRKAILIVIVIV